MAGIKVGDKKLSLCCFIIFLHAFGSSGQVIGIGGLIINVVRTGVEIVKIVDNKGVRLSHINDIVDGLKGNIRSTTSGIKTSIGLSSRLGLIDDTVINIHSSLIDVVNILEATTMTNRDEYTRLFVKRFEDNEMIKYIRFLPQLLTYSIPGASGKLIDLLADNTRCNMTSLDAFKYFYVNLLSDGIAIDLLYLHLSTKLPLNKTINEWNASLIKVANIFGNKQASCMTKFPEFAQEDVNNAVDALTLWSNNKQRYPWKRSDVIFLKSIGTFQFLYHKSRENHLFWQKSSPRVKIAVFNDINDTFVKPDIFVNFSQTLKSSMEGKWDDEAALHVGQLVENHLEEQGLAITSLVVFFEGGKFSIENVQLDSDSQVIQLTIQDVKLSHCTGSSFTCTLDVKNWFGGTEEVSGKMSVFAYVTKADVGREYTVEKPKADVGREYTVEKPTYKIGLSTRNHPVSVAVYLITVLFIFAFEFL